MFIQRNAFARVSSNGQNYTLQSQKMDFTELFCDSALAFCQDMNSENELNIDELDIDELFSEAFQLQLDKPNPTPSTSGAGAAARATVRAAIQQPHPSFIVPPAPAPLPGRGPVPAHATEQPRPSSSANTRFAAPLSEDDIAPKKKKCHPSKHTERHKILHQCVGRLVSTSP